jgi:hypothetical protein
MSKLELVSNQTEEDIKITRARDEAIRALRELTGNLLRIVRGAGKPYQLDKLALDYLVAHRAYYEAAGKWLSYGDKHIALDVYRRPEFEDSSDPHASVMYESDLSMEDAVQASLQVAASRILGDQLRQRRGDSDLTNAMMRWESRRKTRR